MNDILCWHFCYSLVCVFQAIVEMTQLHSPRVCHDPFERQHGIKQDDLTFWAQRDLSSIHFKVIVANGSGLSCVVIDHWCDCCWLQQKEAHNK